MQMRPRGESTERVTGTSCFEAPSAPQGPRAVVIGAGKLYDIPLRKLAERFHQLLLVDIDAAALAESVRQVGLPPKLEARLSLVQADVTGINDAFLQRARAALERTGEVEVGEALLRLLHDYRVDEPPRLFPEGVVEGQLDFACSSMVLSQLATPLTSYVQEQFVARFPASQRTQAPEFQVALGQFTHRVQQAHVRSLLAAAPCIALSSDITDQYTALDPSGAVIHGALLLPLIGAPSLSALVPRRQARTVFTANWHVAARRPQSQQTPRSHGAGRRRRRRARLKPDALRTRASVDDVFEVELSGKHDDDDRGWCGESQSNVPEHRTEKKLDTNGECRRKAHASSRDEGGQEVAFHDVRDREYDYDPQNVTRVLGQGDEGSRNCGQHSTEVLHEGEEAGECAERDRHRDVSPSEAKRR